MTGSYLGSPAQITVDGLVLNSEDDTVTWVFDKIEGWHEGPGVSLSQTQRSNAHGEFGQPGHRTGRTINVEGWVNGTNRAAVAAAMQKLASVLADGGFGEFELVDDDSGALHTTVQLLDRPKVSWVKPTWFDFQLQVTSPDPYRYGAVSSDTTGFAMAAVGAGMVFPLFPDGVMDFGPLGDPGTATVTNAGTADASVVFTVAGPTPAGGFTITDTTTGKAITYLGAVPEGSTLVLDSSDGTVVIDGIADRSGDTIVEAWPQAPPGQTRDFLFEPLSASTAAVLTVECTATYW